MSSIHKKGAGEFTLPGLFKVSAIQVPERNVDFDQKPTPSNFKITGYLIFGICPKLIQQI